MMISNHTFSNLVLRPNGVNPNTIGHDGKPVGDAPDEAALKKLGAKMAAQNGYANIHGWQLYDTTGTTEDWSYNATGGFGYTFEVGANEFHPPYPEVVDQYLGTGEYAGTGNRGAYLVALEHTIDTRYHGVLKGKAPKGATLRLKKVFDTPTWSGSFKDGVESAITVGRGALLLDREPLDPSGRAVPPLRGAGDKPFRDQDHRGWADRARQPPGPPVRPGAGHRRVPHRARLADAGRPGPRDLPQGPGRQADRGRQLRQHRRRQGAGRHHGRRGRAPTCCG